MLIVFVIIIVFILMMSFNFCNPGSGSGHLVEVEHMGVDDFVEVHVAIVAVDDFSLRLERANNLADAAQFLGFHVGSLVEQYDVAELNLLNDEVLNVILFEILLQQVVSASEFILQPECIHHGDDTVESRVAFRRHLGSHLRNGADGLCDGSRFADTAGLNDDVVEAMERYDVLQLLYEVHLQRAADTTVLQGYQRVVLLIYDTSLLYEAGVDVHFTDVVYDDGELDTLLVLKDTVEQCRLAAA